MHGPIRDRLEDLLRAKPEGKSPQAAEHLLRCTECYVELEGMRAQARQFASLRGPEVEPAAGFYARVLQRIEEQEGCSFWAFFADSPLSKGLAMASLAISIALGTYMVSQERAEHRQPAATSFLAADNRTAHYDVPVIGSQDEQRDAVLVNFAEHSAPDNQGKIQ